MNSFARHLAFLIAHIVLASTSFAQSGSANDELPPGKAFAKIVMATNLVEYGLTQTDASPSIQSMLGYRWEQFKMGLWGSNVKFKDGDDDSVNLRLFAVYRFIFTSNADLSARYDFNRYYNGGVRNGSITGLDLNLFEYHVLYDRIENWEGTGSDMIRYGFQKEFVSANDLSFLIGVGYNMLSIEEMENYFDVRAAIGARLAEIKYELVGTYNSAPGQFNGQGDPFVFLNFSATF